MQNPLGGHGRVENVSEIPHYVIALHRLNRLGKAGFYGGSCCQFVEFDLTKEDGDRLREKFPPLADAEAVFFIYDADRRTRVCL